MAAHVGFALRALTCFYTTRLTVMRHLLRFWQGFTLLAFFFCSSWQAQAQQSTDLSQLDRWIRVNRGFAKCASLGNFAGEAEWYTDDFSIDRMIGRRNEMFAYISYGNGGTNTAPCGAGFFRHDTLTNRWIKVGNQPNGGLVSLVTNNTDIFMLAGYPDNSLYVLSEDLVNFPTGWKRIGNFTGNELPGNSCRGNQGVGIGGDILDAIGDTIYILQHAPCNNPNQILKFYVGGDQVVSPLTDISRELIGDLPWQGITQNWLTASAEQHTRIHASALIAGSFNFFNMQMYAGNTLENPYFLWAFDRRRMPNNEWNGMQPFRSDVAMMNGILYYVNDDGTNGYELWRTDGTTAGTYMVADIYANANREAAGGHRRYPKNFVVVGNTLYFTAYSRTSGYELWKTDGTAGGTVLVADLNTGTQGSNAPFDSEPGTKVAIGSTIFFAATNNSTGRELYRSDGNSVNLVSDLASGTGSSNPGNFLVVGTTLFFTATGSAGTELYRLDAPYTTPVLVADIRSGSASSSPANLTNIGTILFFSADGASGRELYKSVPPYSSATLISDIWTGATGSNPRNLYVFNNELFFAAADTVNGTELRRLAGPAYDATTLSMLSINAGSASSFPGQFTALNDTLFFRAQTATNGTELYKMGASNASLRRVTDLNAGAGNSGPQYLTVVGNQLFFTANDGTNGRELYRIGPAPYTTVQRIDVRFGSGSADPHNLTVGPNGHLYFTANDGANGDELWRYNGTSAAMLKNASRANAVYGWRNISDGPDYNNLTGSSNPVKNTDPGYDPYDSDTWLPSRGATRPINSWAPASFVFSFDKKQVFVQTQTGAYKWIGSGYEYVNGTREAGFSLIPTNNGVYQTARGNFKRIDGPVTTNMGNGDFYPTCVHASVRNYTTPDDGKTWYAYKNEMKNPAVCDWATGANAHTGIWRLRVKFDKMGATRNIHVSRAGYFGGDQDDDPRRVAFGGSHRKRVKILVAANIGAHDAALKNRKPAQDVTINWNGYVTTTSAKAQVLRYNQQTDTLEQITYLGTNTTDQVWDMESMNKRHPVLGKRMAAIGDFGLVCLDSMGNFLWRVPSSELPGVSGNQAQVDIDDNGHVAVLRKLSNFNYQFRVYDQDGQAYSGVTGVGREFANDIAIKNDTVVVCGFRNGCLPGTGPKCNGASGNTGSCGGAEIQTCFIWYYAPTSPGNSWSRYAVTYDYPEGAQGRDIADTRMYHLNFGHDGKLYFVGETAGSESIYRWDGSQYGTTELNSVRLGLCDGNSSVPNGTISQDGMVRVSNADLSNTASAHICFFGQADISKVGPGNYVHVIKGDWIIPRLSDGKSNTFSVSNDKGYITAGPDGAVYVTGSSAFQFPGRPVQKVNGQSIGNYAGDAVLYVSNPGFGGLRFIGTFGKPGADGNTGGGTARGVAVNDSLVVYLNRLNSRENFTFAPNQSSTRWNLASSTLADGYMALFYSDLSTYAKRDSIIETIVPGDTIINPDYLTLKVDFASNIQSACVSPVGTHQVSMALSNTTNLLNVSRNPGWSWKVRWSFGPGAQVVSGNAAFNGTANNLLTGYANPVVRWTTDGLKTISVRIVGTHATKDSLVLEEIKYNYINIFPASFTLGTMAGPAVVCNNGVYYYEITVPSSISWAVNSYSWTVPTGATIINGQGTRRIAVRMGSSNGNVSVVGVTNCGNTTPVNRAITVDVPVFQALVVADRMSLTAGEQAVITDLTSRGYTITLREDNDLDTNDFLCKNIIVLLSTVDPALIGTKFRNIATPVVVMKPELLPLMNMVATGNSGILASQTQVNVLTGTSDLRGTLPTGLTNIYRLSRNLGWGTPHTTATIVAEVNGDATKAAYFAYPSGTVMANGFTAPGRRVFIFPPDRAAIDSVNTAGQYLISRALCWADNNCNTPVITTRAISRSVYSLYDTIGVNFHTTGTFNAGNQFRVQWSDAFGDFSNPTNTAGGLTLTGSNVRGSVEVNPIPSTLPSGARYALRIVSTNPVAYGSAITNITLRDLVTGEPKIIYVCSRRQSRGEVLEVQDTGTYNAIVRNFELPVEFVTPSEVNYLRLAGAKLVVVSNTAASASATDQNSAFAILKNLPVPVLTHHLTRLWDQGSSNHGLGLTSANGSLQGSSANPVVRNIHIQNITHPITQGYDGWTPWYAPAEPAGRSFGVVAQSALGANVVQLASTRLDNSNCAIFVQETGTLLVNGNNAPARRAFFPMTQDGTTGRWASISDDAKKLYVRTIAWCLNETPREITKATATVSNKVCSGAKFTVSITAPGLFRADNRFIVQMSDASGSFTSPGYPLEVGSLASTLALPVEVTVPQDLAPGLNYRMRVISTNPYIVGPLVEDTLQYVQVDDRHYSRRTITGGSSMTYNNTGETIGSNWITTDDYTAQSGWSYAELTSNTCGTESRFRLTPVITSAGTYEVFVTYPALQTNRGTTNFVVTHAGGTTTVPLNQQVGGGRWLSLGSYTFNAGQTGYVELVCGATGQQTARWDGLRLVRNYNAPAPAGSAGPKNFVIGNLWTGAVSSSWHNPGNWSICGSASGIPDSNTAVIIPSGLCTGCYAPVVTDSNAVCASMLINYDAQKNSLTINNDRTLRVLGAITNNDTIRLLGTGAIRSSGNRAGSLTNNGWLLAANASTIYADITNTSVFSITSDATAGNGTFYGIANSSTGTFTMQALRTINVPNGLVNNNIITLPRRAVINGNITQNAGTFNFAPKARVMGNVNLIAGSLTWSSAVITDHWTITGNLTLGSAATLSINVNQHMRAEVGGVTTNNGTINVTNGGWTDRNTFEYAGYIVNNGTMNIRGADGGRSASFLNRGILNNGIIQGQTGKGDGEIHFEGGKITNNGIFAYVYPSNQGNAAFFDDFENSGSFRMLRRNVRFRTLKNNVGGTVELGNDGTASINRWYRFINLENAGTMTLGEQTANAASRTTLETKNFTNSGTFKLNVPSGTGTAASCVMRVIGDFSNTGTATINGLIRFNNLASVPQRMAGLSGHTGGIAVDNSFNIPVDQFDVELDTTYVRHHGLPTFANNGSRQGNWRMVYQDSSSSRADSVVSYPRMMHGDGNYKVEIYTSQLANRCTATRYYIMHNGVKDSASVNQSLTTNNGVWINLGTYYFRNSLDERVIMGGYDRGNCTMAFDGIRFTYMDGCTQRGKPGVTQTAATALPSGDLTLTNGKFYLGDNNLTLGTGTVANAGSARYVVSNSNPDGGRLVQTVGAGTVNFPIGLDTNYTPVAITNGNSAAISATVLEGMRTGVTTGSFSCQNMVNRTWLLGTSGTVTNATVRMQWDAMNEGTGFARASSEVYKGVTGVWTSQGQSARVATAPYAVEQTGQAISASDYFMAASGPPASCDKIWVGTTSADWFTGSNWSPAGVPTASSSIVIPSAPNAATITTGSAECYDIRITTGTVSMSGGTLNVSGDFARDAAGTFTATGGTVVMRGAVASSIAGTNTFANLRIEKAAGVRLPNGQTTVNNTFTMTAQGRLVMAADSTSAVLRLLGNFDNTAGGRLQLAAGKILMNGSSQQSLLGTSRFLNLEINNSAGVQVASPDTIGNNLNFIAGRLILGSSNLILADGATITGAGANAYVQSNLGLSGGSIVARVGSSNVLFPVGTTTYTPVTVGKGLNKLHSVKIGDGVRELAVSGNTLTNRVVNRTWYVQPDFSNENFIHDESDAGVTFYGGGNWSSYTSSTAIKQTARENGANATGDSVVYVPTVPTTGMYELFVYVPNNNSGNACNSQIYTVRHVNGTTAVTLTSIQRNTWISLGTFEFNAGSSLARGAVRVRTTCGSGGRTVVDAFKYDFRGPTTGADIAVQWNTTEELPSFSTARAKLSFNLGQGADWDFLATTTYSGTNPKTATGGGATKFPYFTVGGFGTNRWTGATDSSWTNLANWSLYVPDSTDDVEIPATITSTRFPSLGSGTVKVRNLVLGGGSHGNIRLRGGRLEVFGNVDNSQGGLFRQTGGKLVMKGSAASTISGNNTLTNLEVQNAAGVSFTGTTNTVLDSLTLNGGRLILNQGTLTVNNHVRFRTTASQFNINDGQLVVRGNFDNSAQGRFIMATTGGSVNFAGTSQQSILGRNTFRDLTVANSSVAGLVLPSDSTYVNRELIVSGRLTMGAGHLVLRGNATINGTMNVTGGTTHFVGSTAQTIGGLTPKFFNVRIAKTGGAAVNLPLLRTTVMGNLSLQTGQLVMGDSRLLDVRGNLAFSSTGNLIMPGGTVELHGNFDNTAAGNFSMTGGNLQMLGSTNTEILGNNVFHYLTINKGQNTNVVKVGSMTVNSQLELTKGILRNEGGTNIIKLPETAVLSIETDDARIVGHVQQPKTVSAATAAWPGLGVSLNPNSEDLGQVVISRTSGLAKADTSFVTSPVLPGARSIDVIWRIVPTTQPENPVQLSLSWSAANDNGNNPGIMLYAYRRQAPYTGIFEKVTTAMASSTRTMVFNTSGFSEWTLGDENNPLPVELVNFYGHYDKKKADVNLFWATASERNNAWFMVERSTDNIEFATIGSVRGQGNSVRMTSYKFVDEEPGRGIVYYRLRQVDHDGTTTYSKVISMRLGDGDQPELRVFPNPAHMLANVEAYGLQGESRAIVRLINMQGADVYTSEASVSPAGVLNHRIGEVQRLPRSIYVVKVITGNTTLTQKLELK